MDRQKIFNEITSIVGSNPKSWSIGITHEPEERRLELEKPRKWHQWDVATIEDAKMIEGFFVHEIGVTADNSDNLNFDKVIYAYLFQG